VRSVSVTQRRSREVIWWRCRTGGTNSNSKHYPSRRLFVQYGNLIAFFFNERPLTADIFNSGNAIFIRGFKMKKIIWKDEYSVGIEKIDRQHQHLFEIINKIIDRSDSDAGTDIVSETIMEMVNYAREHFTDEESLMRQYDYPNLEAHKKEHNYFIDTTAEFAVDFMDNGNTSGDEIAEFLSIWLTNHILKTDMKYKELLLEKMPAGV